jgi:nitrite reductase/ring-hydroxylating ferredoxin subunit
MVALVAPGALVAACSDGGSSAGGTPTTGESAPAGGGAGQALAALADVPDGGGLVVENPAGGKILLARTGTEVKAYNAACTHMGTILDPPRNGLALCRNHGSEFDTATGDVKKGPATKPLIAVEVKVEGAQVVLA